MQCSAQEYNAEKRKTGIITIRSPFENAIAMYHKVAAFGKMYDGKSAPQYVLFVTSEGWDIFGGEAATFLGWYVAEKDMSKEIIEIHDAIVNKIATYTLKYSARTIKGSLE